MKKAATLDEMINWPQEDLKLAFGEKTAGLALMKSMIYNSEFSEIPFDIRAGEGYGVQECCDLTDAQVINSLDIITKNLTEKRIIIARSSTFNELPGKYISVPFSWDPSLSRDINIESWIQAAQKVRASGSGPILAHLLSYRLEDFIIDEDYDSNPSRIERTSVRCFGGTPVSFYAKTTTPWGAVPGNNRPFNVRFARGMGTRIAHGNESIILSLEDNDAPSGTANFNTSWNYSIRVESMFAPAEVDVILEKDPNCFSTIRYNIHTGSVDGMDDSYRHQPIIGTLDGTQVPWGTDWLATSDNGFTKFKPKYILKVLEIMQNKLGSEVEIEGSITKDRINLCQVRGYTAPTRDFHQLSKVSDERLVLQTKNNRIGRGYFNGELSIGGKKFEGNIIISEKPIPIQEGDILMCGGSAYDLGMQNFQRGINLALVNADFIHSAHAQTDIGQHAIGAVVNTLSRLEQRDVNAISLSPTYIEFMRNPEVLLQGRRNPIYHCGICEIPNMIIECTREGAQIYLGKE